MDTTEVTTEQDSNPAARRTSPSRRVMVIVATLVVPALGAGWWWLTAPRLEAGVLAGVWSDDHPVFRVEGVGGTAFLVPAEGSGETQLAFGVVNHGRLPVEILEVWPDAPEGTCFWSPTGRELRDDRRSMYTSESPSVPADGATVRAGSMATLWFTGRLPATTSCVHGAAILHDSVETTVRIGWRTTTVQVPLDYVFGYVDDPEEFTAQYGVSVGHPGEDG